MGRRLTTIPHNPLYSRRTKDIKKIRHSRVQALSRQIDRATDGTAFVVISTQVYENEVYAALLSFLEPLEELRFVDGAGSGLWCWEGRMPRYWRGSGVGHCVRQESRIGEGVEVRL